MAEDEASMSVTGVREAKRRIGQITRQMILEAEKAAMFTQEEVVRQAKRDAPVGTPESTGIPNYIISEAYKRSIRRLPPTKKLGVFTASVAAGGLIVNPNTGRPVDYSLDIEYGNRRKYPEGIMVPSLVSKKQFLRNEVVKGIRRVK